MNKTKPLSIAIKIALGIATVSLPFTSFANEADDGVMLEEVVATGSHIKGLDLEGATNAVQLDSKDIMESGADSLSDLLDGLSVTGGGNGTFTTEGAGPGSDQSPVGSSAVSLRGLGTSSTLTLINGRRVSVASFAKGGTESFVDINSIPLAAIERVEILPSGASATYGADAVAGVVNVILKKDYEGLQISTSYGNSTASSDNGKTNLNLTWGKSTENARGMVVVDYFKREALYERDRDITSQSRDPSADSNVTAINSGLGRMNDVIDEEACADNANGRLTPADTDLGRSCLYNTNDVVTAQGEYESIGLTSTFEYDFEFGTWFNELMYQSNTSNGNRAGSPWELALSDQHPGFAGEQELIDALEESYADSDADGYVPVGGLTATDVLNLIEADSDTYGNALDDYYLTAFGRFDEPRAVEVETQSLRFVTGMEGQFNSWDWETAASFGRSTSKQKGLSGLYNREKLQASLLGKLCDDGTIVEGDYEINGDIAEKESVDYSPGGDTCEDLGKTTAWYSPFNAQLDQPEGIDSLLRADGSREGESNLYSWDFKASTLDLFTLPAGAVAGAFGVEWRREDVKDTPSEESRATDANSDPIISFSSTGAEYERDQYAAYGELSIPLMDNLEAQVAGRYDEYDDFGGDFNGKIGLRYQFNDQLTFRANWSESFRAPSMAQAGLTKKLTSYTAACDLSDPYTIELLDGFYCGVDQDYDFPYDESRGMNTELVGNDKLKAETADTYGFGVLYRPTYDIELNLDWWKIEYNNTVLDAEDAYVVATLNGLTDGVVTTEDLQSGTPGVQLYCDPTGYTAATNDDCNASGSDYGPEIADVHFQPFNAGKQTVEGIDLVYTHYLMDNAHGSLTLLADASFLINFEEELIKGYGADSKEGEYTYPQLVAKAKLRYRFQNWGTSFSANYTGEYKDDLNGSDAAKADGFDTDASDGVIDERTVPSWITYDLNVSYDLANDSFVQLNIQNILDEEPNYVYASGSNVDYSNTNIMGRFVTLRYNHVF